MSVMADLETTRQVLRAQLLQHLDTLPPMLRQDVVEALSVEGKLLHQPCDALDGRWALLPFLLASELSADPDPSYACGAALAIECVVCATDLFDDVMDEDVNPLLARLGAPCTLTVALTLTALAQRVLLALVEQSTSAELPLPLLDALQHALVLASAGQHQDLLAEQRPAWTLSRAECLAIAEMKAGSLLGLACRMGAICAGVSEVLIEQCAELGRLLGIAAQLDNDVHDLAALLELPTSQKSDLKRGKKTLPVVLAAHALRELPGLSEVDADRMLQNLASLPQSEQEMTISALREGILATWGISLLYRERASDCLHTLSEGRVYSSMLYVILGLAEPSTREFASVQGNNAVCP